MAKLMPSGMPKRTALGSALISAIAIQPMAIADQSSKTAEMIIIGKGVSTLQKEDSTATKMDLSLKDTGRSITQLDEQQISDLAIKDVRQAFEYVAGFRANGPADRTYTARGVRTSIDNVMVDGLRSLQGGEGGTGSRLPSTFNTESASFLRGPAGLINGSSTGGGIVNITTKKPQEESQTTLGVSTRSYLSDDTGYGERNSTSFSLDSTGKISDSDVLYRIIADYTPSGDHFQENRQLDEKLLDAALTFKIGEKTKLTPRVEITDREKTGGSSYADGVFESNFASGDVSTYGEPINRGKYYGSPKDKGDNKSKSYSLRLDHEFSDDWSMIAQARHNNTDSEALDLYISDSSALNNAVGKDNVNRKWVFSKGEDSYDLFDFSTQGKFTTGALQHHIATGISYRDLEVKFERNFQDSADAVGKNTISASNPNNQIIGPVPSDLRDVNYSPVEEKDTNIYLKDRITYGNFTVLAGVAHVKQKQKGENYSSSYSDTIWDLGTVYAVNKNLNLFATYSRSYEPVSSRSIAKYGQGKSDYKPIEGQNYEIGFKGNFFDGKLDAAVTAFNLERENNTSYSRNDQGWLLSQDSGVAFRSKGLEIDAQVKITPQLTSTISYAYTRAADTGGDNKGVQANNTPKHSIAIWNSYQLTGKYSPIRLGLGVRYEGERNDGSNRIKAYTEADLGAYYETADWDAGLTLRNVFDKNRAEAGANWVTVQPNEPRSLNLTFKYRM